jgi:hypothetical protein
MATKISKLAYAAALTSRSCAGAGCAISTAYGTHTTGTEFARSNLLLPDRFLVHKKFYWVDNNKDFPCDCCSPDSAPNTDYTYWECRTGRKWLILDEEPDMSKPHSKEICTANCNHHPLMTIETIILEHSDHYNTSWGDFLVECEDYIKSLESAAQTAARIIREQELRKSDDLDSAVRLREAYASKMATIASIGQRHVAPTSAVPNPTKNSPCKWLVGSQHMASIKRDEMPQCWAWEYIDPKTKKSVIKHVCPFIHPGQPGWHHEWLSNPSFKPSTPSTPSSSSSSSSSTYSSTAWRK